MTLVEGAREFGETQDRPKVSLSTEIDTTYAGVAEAWANGMSWLDVSRPPTKQYLESRIPLFQCIVLHLQIVDGCGLHEGDLARLLRRTIDLLSQIRELNHVSPELREVARAAKKQMDRPPINELF